MLDFLIFGAIIMAVGYYVTIVVLKCDQFPMGGKY